MTAPFSSQLDLQTLKARLYHGLLWTCWGLNRQCFPQANTLCAVRVDIECFVGGSSRGTVTPISSTKDRFPSKGGHPLTQHTAWRGTRRAQWGKEGTPASSNQPTLPWWSWGDTHNSQIHSHLCCVRGSKLRFHYLRVWQVEVVHWGVGKVGVSPSSFLFLWLHPVCH